jgi:hypothetical protein
VDERLRSKGLDGGEIDRAISLLVWFGFLGYWSGPDAERFSHQYQHDLRKMEAGLLLQRTYTVHRAFRSTLECVDPE